MRNARSVIKLEGGCIIIYNKFENLDSTKAKTIKILVFLDFFSFFFEIG